LFDLRQGLDGDPGGGVHGDIDRDDAGIRAQAIVEFLDRQVTAGNGMPVPFQECGGFGKAKRLSAQFIGVDQCNLHMMFNSNSVLR
jgi:hypothetical protein